MIGQRHMIDDLDALDARLGAVGNANRAAEPAVNPRFAAMRQPEAPQMPMQAPQAPVPAPAPPATSELPRGFINDLRSWSSNYRFTAEMEYIKISRTGPAMHRGVNATGWLCDVYQPFDEQYLASVWGGGTYVIVAYQNGGGGAREVARGYTQINGNPRAYRGPDGQPVLFPTDGSESRSLLPGVPSPTTPQSGALPAATTPQQTQAGQGVPFPVVNNYPPPTPAPAIDLISLAEKFSGNKQEAKSLEVLQAAQAQNNEFYKSALDRSIDEQKQLREQLLTMQQNQSAPMQNAIEMYRAQMETRERAHAETMKQMVAEHTAQLQALRQQADKAIEEQRRGFDATLLNMREENRAREQSVRDAWRVETDNLRRELDTQRQTNLTEMQRHREATAAEMQRLRETSTTETQRLRETSTAEVQRLRDEQRRELDIARRDVEVARAETDRREQIARDSTRAQYETQIRILETQLTSSKEEVERREQNARETARSNFEAQIKMLENQLQATKEQLEQRLSDMRAMNTQAESAMRSTFELQLSQRDSEINRLRDELNVARNEANTLRNDLSEKRDPMTTLNEVANLTQTFQSITGQNNAPAKEEEPKGFVAQLAKYAPAIGEHLVKPTMKPIAEVMETVRERDRREEELRRDILIRRQALQARGGNPQPQLSPQQQMIQQQMMQQQMMQQQMAQQQMAQQQMAQQQMMQQQAARQRINPANVPAPVVTLTPRKANNTVVKTTAEDTQPAFQPAGVIDAEVVAPSDQENAGQQPLSPETAELAQLLTKDLVDYVDNAMATGTGASELADQMKMGASFGVIDPTIIDKVKATPLDVMLDLFMEAAADHGAMNLGSPRGEDYLTGVYAALQR